MAAEDIESDLLGENDDDYSHDDTDVIATHNDSNDSYPAANLPSHPVIFSHRGRGRVSEACKTQLSLHLSL